MNLWKYFPLKLKRPIINKESTQRILIVKDPFNLLVLETLNLKIFEEDERQIAWDGFAWWSLNK